MGGATKLEHGDSVYRLRLTNRALVRLGEESDHTTPELFQRAVGGDFRSITLLFWASLLHERPRLTVYQAADMIDLPDMRRVAEALGKEVERAFGDLVHQEPDAAEEGGEENPPAATG